ncbi:LysM repeat protein [Caldalkalibacillus uzonensis]|uniref:LysM repeat protein n=1 Tax=Caldalkalibacillus uzonensis TaxID=353224 RepID=A0ABU0CVQ6_9BACI|nr:LysM repeat protein [Caldalkalibacillus uzonensis]
MRRKVLTASASAVIMLTAYAQDADASEKTYTVQRGDSLWKISRQYQVTIEQLMAWNNLSSSTIYVGQRLYIAAPQKHTSASGGSSSNTYQPATYTVKAGDTLWNIARNYGTTVAQLKSVNNLSSDLIRVGQVLTIPGSSSNNTTSNNTTSSKPHVTVESNPTSSATYTVKPGDSLWKIAREHNMTVNELKALNNLTSDLIRVGQVLRVAGAPVSNTNNSANNSSSSASFNVSALIEEAKKYMGAPYRWGGSSPSTGFDCSGFLQYIFRSQGVNLPRTVASIWSVGTTVSNPQPGDVVFFETYTSGPSHAGIYLGNNQFIHSGTSTGVTISNMTTSYWSQRYLGAKRYR